MNGSNRVERVTKSHSNKTSLFQTCDEFMSKVFPIQLNSHNALHLHYYRAAAQLN